MSYGELRAGLRDVSFTTATPFGDEQEAVRHEALAENLRWLYEAGARTFIPCGNTGEYYALSRRERKAVVGTTVDALPDDATVVGGAGGSIPDAIDLLESYAEAGVDGAMIMHPGHAYVHEQGLIDYYRQLAAATDLGIVVYKRGSEVTESVLSALADVENVVAVKYAANDVKTFARWTETVPDVLWLNGVAERYAPAYAIEGADGFTTGVGNFLPRPVLALNSALEAGEWERAKRIRDLLRPIEELREEAGGGDPFGSAKNVPVVKRGLDLRELNGGPVRRPLVDLADEDVARLRDYLDAIDRAAFE